MPAAATRGAPPGPAGFPVVGVFPWRVAIRSAFSRNACAATATSWPCDSALIASICSAIPITSSTCSRTTRRAYAKGPTVSRVRPLFGESLTMVDGERWRGRRRHVQPAFQPGLHGRFASVVLRAVAELLDRWRLAGRARRARGAGRRDAAAHPDHHHPGLLREHLLGELQALGQALDAAVTHVDRRLWSPLGWLDVPSPASARYRRALGEVEAFTCSPDGRGTPLRAAARHDAGRPPRGHRASHRSRASRRAQGISLRRTHDHGERAGLGLVRALGASGGAGADRGGMPRRPGRPQPSPGGSTQARPHAPRDRGDAAPLPAHVAHRPLAR